MEGCWLGLFDEDGQELLLGNYRRQIMYIGTAVDENGIGVLENVNDMRFSYNGEKRSIHYFKIFAGEFGDCPVSPMYEFDKPVNIVCGDTVHIGAESIRVILRGSV